MAGFVEAPRWHRQGCRWTCKNPPWISFVSLEISETRKIITLCIDITSNNQNAVALDNCQILNAILWGIGGKFH